MMPPQGPRPMQPQMRPAMPGQMPGQQPMQPPHEAEHHNEPTFTVKLRKRPTKGRCCINVVPPEEFRISRRAPSIEKAAYHAWVYHDYTAELIEDHPDKAHELEPGFQSTGSELEPTNDPRIMARFPNEPDAGRMARSRSNEVQRRMVEVRVEYVRLDFDGDGIVELRRIKRVGNTILENDIVDDSEFVVWSPIRVAHRLIGRSLADTLIDIQEIRTQLTRRALDSLSRSLMPRTAINENALDTNGTTIDRLLNHDIGDLIVVKGDPKQAITELVTPDVSPQAFAAIQYWDQRSEEATGVTRGSQGIRPSEQHDTASGIDKLQSAANARIEQVARWLGFGLQQVMVKVLKVIATHQDHARIIKVNGRRLDIDPRRWSDEMTVNIHVGMAAESREKKVAMLSTILGVQKDILINMGMSNPLVGVNELRNTLAMITDAMGYRSAKRFFKEIPEGYQPPEGQPDPKMAEAQGKMQLAQAEMQAKQQLQQQELQHKQQAAQQAAQIQLQIESQKATQAHEIEKVKQDGAQEIARLKLASEEQMAAVRMEQEERLALRKMEQEREFALQAMALKATQPDVNQGGFRPGGRLDA